MSSRAAIEAAIDAYERAIRQTSDAQRRLAGRVPLEPVRTVLRVSADLTRDIGATQVSVVRWVLDS
jgi:hypothetical protein